ncbi:hypothetical protein [Hymenobacter sp. BT190]|uniref:hypothetical protein n=1 Tax=Hymenobacter sp. BT190 TaxID=2763505 RepID=UPI00165125F9|nr:hypothetical protein [Hymenobacter sp. BT190]MBC6696756.1 hypothetical protein [Hymenobacter sp. BT190]
MSLVYMMNSLQLFAARALRQLPVALWWVLGLFVGAICSIQLEKELFPNTPAAVRVAQIIWKLCVVLVPLLTMVWLWRVALLVQHPAWRLMWAIAAGGAAIATGLLMLLLVFVLLT